MKKGKEDNHKTLEDYEFMLDKQLAKLEMIDEEDQSSYKIIDYTLRTADTIKSYCDAKMRFELLKSNSIRKYELKNLPIKEIK